MDVRISLLFVGCILLVRRGAPQCIVIPNAEGEPFPDIFDVAGISYQVSVEINNFYEKKTTYVTEYQELLDGYSLVEIKDNSKTTIYLYLAESDEFFAVVDGVCKTGRRKDIDSLLKDVPVYSEDNRVTIGPSSFFRKAFVDNTSSYLDKETVRGKKVDMWENCLDTDSKMNYYFTVSGWEDPYTFQEKHVPVRVEVEKINAAKKKHSNYDFYGFQPYVSSLNIFQIPRGVGCSRLANDLPKPPAFTTHDISYTVELIYSTTDENFNEEAYVSFLSVVSDVLFKHYSYSYTPWISRKGRQPDARNSSLNQIYDTEYGYLYTVIKETGRCHVQKRPKDFSPTIPLPGGEQIAVKDKDFFFGQDGFVYLGEEKARGLHVQVYEKTIPEFRWLGSTADPVKAVYTRRYLKDTTYNAMHGKDPYLPVQSVLQVYAAKSEKNVVTTLTANTFIFSNDIKQRNKLFDVSSCFTRREQQRWMELTFVVKEDDLRFLENEEEQIQEKVYREILDAGDVAPVRVPEIQVGFDSKHVYVKWLFLERPNFADAFSTEKPEVVINPSSTIGMIPLDQCAKHCLENTPSCWAFSYCGTTCYLSLTITPPTKASDVCSTFIRDDVKAIPTSDQVSMKFALNFMQKTPIATITVKTNQGKSNDIDLTPSSFNADLGVKPDFDILTKDGVEQDDVFRVYQYRASLDRYAQDNHVQDISPLSYKNCRRVCMSNTKCESFSYCALFDRCVHTTYFGEEIPPNYVKDNDQCIVMSRRYISTYSHLPGVSIAHESRRQLNVSVGQCARACKKEKGFDCKSFDYCPDVEGGDLPCLLHKDHFRDEKEVLLEKRGLCGHYSRNYVYDFQMYPGRRIATVDATFPVYGIDLETCAHDCVQSKTVPCASFDYCPGSSEMTSKCLLTSMFDSQVKLEDSLGCDHYTALGGKEDKNPKDPKGRQYSTAVAGGLGFFFFIFGLGMGLIIFMAYKHFKGKTY